MTEPTELVQDTLERHEHMEHNPKDNHAQKMALLIGMLAAGLALSEMAEKSSQNAYLAHHVEVSDDWAFYQAKTLRANMAHNTIDIIASMPVQDAATAKRIKDLTDTVARMDSDPKTGEGRKEMQEKAKRDTELRDHSLHRYHDMEKVVGALQIAIVLASVSVVTKIRKLGLFTAGLGFVASLYGAASILGFLD